MGHRLVPSPRPWCPFLYSFSGSHVDSLPQGVPQPLREWGPALGLPTPACLSWWVQRGCHGSPERATSVVLVPELCPLTAQWRPLWGSLLLWGSRTLLWQRSRRRGLTDTVVSASQGLASGCGQQGKSVLAWPCAGVPPAWLVCPSWSRSVTEIP